MKIWHIWLEEMQQVARRRRETEERTIKKCEGHCVISALFEVTMPATAQNYISSNGMHNNHT